MSGTLYVVATPIGNLKDITLRVLEILKEVDLILAEDTRVTKKLLIHYQIDTHILSYHQHSSDEKKFEILRLLLEGKNLALVTDAGTPGISDPGNELIDFLISKDSNLKIVPIPGASALITALSVSGLNINKFVFLGFLPKKGKNKLFDWLKEGEFAFCFYESPYRLTKSLENIREYFGEDTKVFIARELTKIYETLYRGSINEVINKVSERTVKGEIVVVVKI